MSGGMASGGDCVLSSSRKNQILQTVISRTKEGLLGAPDSYPDEEKEYYREMEKDILEIRKAGFQGTFAIPNDYD